LFDGFIEVNSPPTPPHGCQIFDHLNDASFKILKSSKSSNKRVREDGGTFTSNNLQDDVSDNPNSSVEVDLFEDDNFIEEDIDKEELLWKKRSIFLIPLLVI